MVLALAVVSRRGGSRGDDGGDGCLDSRVFSIRFWDDLSYGGNVEFVDASRISMVSIFFFEKNIGRTKIHINNTPSSCSNIVKICLEFKYILFG